MQVEKIRKEAGNKIVVMQNKAAAVYYKGDNSITRMDNELELKADKSQIVKILFSIQQSTMEKTSQLNNNIINLANQ